MTWWQPAAEPVVVTVIRRLRDGASQGGQHRGAPGAHDFLLATDGLYRDLATTQMLTAR